VKKLLTVALALLTHGVLSGMGYAQQSRTGQPNPPAAGYKLTVSVHVGTLTCTTTSAAVVQNIPPWGTQGLLINCSPVGSGGPTLCTQSTIPPGTVIHLSSAVIPPGWGIPSPFIPPPLVISGCVYPHPDCEFKMPPNDVVVGLVELPCPPPTYTPTKTKTPIKDITNTPTKTPTPAKSAYTPTRPKTPTGLTYTPTKSWGRPA